MPEAKSPVRSPSPGAPAPEATAASASAAAASTPVQPASSSSSTSSVASSSSSSSASTSLVASDGSSSSSSSAVVPRRRKKGSGRPSKGGLAIGFTADELKAQAAKRAAWMKEEVTERVAIRSAVAAADAKSSNRALRVMLMVWVCVVIAIFWHVWRTMARGLATMARERGFAHDLPASTLILNAFKESVLGQEDVFGSDFSRNDY